MKTVATKTEEALRAYIIANFQATGEPLHGATIYAGHRNTPHEGDAYVSFLAEGIGGPHARQGNYELTLAMLVVTNSQKPANETTDRLTVHEQRVEALAGIFSEARKATVCAALMVLDPELGVSAYWGHDRDNELDGQKYMTAIRSTFAVHLA